MKILLKQRGLQSICFLSALLVLPSILFAGQKIIFIDSYHQGYAWSDGVRKGLHQALDGSGHDLKIYFMDTKRNRGEDFIKQAAIKAKNIIENYKPDIIISSDDNAAKYLIVPYFREGDIPVVFCGINWDASPYGFPTANITGMVEIDLIDQLINQAKKYAKGPRLGYLALNSFTNKKAVKNFASKKGITFEQVAMVDTYAQWKKAYLEMQTNVDIILIANNQGVRGWNELDFKKIVLSKSKIPSATYSNWQKNLALITLAKIPAEQGIYAGETALRILAGESPADIPVTTNKQGFLALNMALADKLNIVFTPEIIKRATLLRPYDDKTVVHIDSYHQGYGWSDGIREGIAKELKKSGAKLLTFAMDTKRNPSDDFKKAAALKARDFIEQAQPDVVIASDDNSSKYLVQEYYKNAKLPFIFCGVNWDASEYGYPYQNATGMIEIDFGSVMAKQLLRYGKGNRVGVIGVNRPSEKKIVKFWQKKKGLQVHQSYFVDTFEEWVVAYKNLQNEADILIFMNPVGLRGWDDGLALDVVRKYGKIPSGCYDKAWMRYNLLGYIKSAHEQGNWSAKTAIAILGGKSPQDIPITSNKEQIIMLNPEVVKRLGIVIKRSFYKRATIYNED